MHNIEPIIGVILQTIVYFLRFVLQFSIVNIAVNGNVDDNQRPWVIQSNWYFPCTHKNKCLEIGQLYDIRRHNLWEVTTMYFSFCHEIIFYLPWFRSTCLINTLLGSSFNYFYLLVPNVNVETCTRSLVANYTGLLVLQIPSTQSHAYR